MIRTNRNFATGQITGDPADRHQINPVDEANTIMPLLQQLAGHDHALDLVGALVDLGDLGMRASFRR